MRKILINIVCFGIVLLIGIWIGNKGIKLLWGEAESTLVASTIKDENSNIEDLFGNYKSEEGFDITSSEIMFAIEGDIELTVGKFKKFDIDLEMANKLSSSKISVSIDVGSIFTDNSKRDGHLLDEDFFDSENYPQITFNSVSIKPSHIGDDCYKYISTGKLSMLGTQKDIDIKFNYKGSSKNKNGQDIAIFDGSFNFDRTQYGMSVAESVGNQVKVNFYTELLKQDNKAQIEKLNEEVDEFDF